MIISRSGGWESSEVEGKNQGGEGLESGEWRIESRGIDKQMWTDYYTAKQLFLVFANRNAT